MLSGHTVSPFKLSVGLETLLRCGRELQDLNGTDNWVLAAYAVTFMSWPPEVMSSECDRVEKWWGTNQKRVPGYQIGKSIWRVRVSRKEDDVHVLLYALFIVSGTVVFAAIDRPVVVIRTIALVTKPFGSTAVLAENRNARVQNFPFWLARFVRHAFLSVREWEYAAPMKIERFNGNRKCAAQQPRAWPTMQGLMSIGYLAV